MSNVVNFSELKRRQIRRCFENGIEIYNPNKEQRTEIFNMIVGDMDNDNSEVLVSGKQVLLKLIPMLTNIYLDLENEELIDEILNDPSEILLDIQDEMVEIVKSITNRTFKTMKDMAELPEHIVNELIGE